MYTLNDAQINFIRQDLRDRGILRLSLQQDLLDHVCCMLEDELETDTDFERAYHSLITRFYKTELAEIERETNHLLQHQNYYAMKKIMMGSGLFAVSALTAGIVLKFLHLPGAGVLLLLGIGALSVVFLPLMFLLKSTETQTKSSFVISGVGTMAAMMLSLGVLSKIMHWPMANKLCLIALFLMLLVFLPVYFFTGIRKPETKTNTAISSILLLAGCALILVMVRRPDLSRQMAIDQTAHFLRNEQILQNEQQLLGVGLDADVDKIQQLCNALKAFLIQRESGFVKLPHDFEQRGKWLEAHHAKTCFDTDPDAARMLKDLQSALQQYNQTGTQLPHGTAPVIEVKTDQTVPDVLNALIQIQMMVLQNQRLANH